MSELGDNTPVQPSAWDEPKLDPSLAALDFHQQPLVKTRRKLLMGVLIVLGSLALVSVVYAMTHRTKRVKAERELTPKVYGNSVARVPDSIRDLEVATTPAAPAVQKPAEDAPPEAVEAMPKVKEADYVDQQAEKYLGEAPYDDEPAPRYAANTGSYQPPPRRQQDGDCCGDGALPSISAPPAKESQQGVSGGLNLPSMPQGLGPQVAALGQASQQLEGIKKLLEGAQGEGGDDDARKEQFMERGGLGPDIEGAADVGECEISAGTPVHVSMLPAMNSDLPANGVISAIVTKTVYCGNDHQYVAIPQGSKFSASLDARVTYGQERLQLCIQRLRLPPSADHPNGQKLDTGCLAAADITGQVGLPADVDNHWPQLITGAALSAVLSIGAGASAGNQQGFAPTLAQNAAHAGGQSISRAGDRIVQREMMRKATLRVEALEFGVVVWTKDAQLEPWRPRKGRRAR